MTAASRYGFFAIMHVQGGIVTLPDGETTLHFESLEEAQKKWAAECDKHVAEFVLPGAAKKVAEDRQAFMEGCWVSEERVKQPGLLTSDTVVKRVIDSDGAYVGDPSEKGFREIVEQAALERFPEPTASKLRAQVDGGVKETVVWAASLFLDGEHKRLPAFSAWTYGLPIEEVLEVLNELAAEGWTVVNVSEDRGLYAGLTNRTDSSVTTARYLLSRDA